MQITVTHCKYLLPSSIAYQQNTPQPSAHFIHLPLTFISCYKQKMNNLFIGKESTVSALTSRDNKHNRSVSLCFTSSSWTIKVSTGGKRCVRHNECNIHSSPSLLVWRWEREQQPLWVWSDPLLLTDLSSQAERRRKVRRDIHINYNFFFSISAAFLQSPHRLYSSFRAYSMTDRLSFFPYAWIYYRAHARTYWRLLLHRGGACSSCLPPLCVGGLLRWELWPY